MTLWGDSDMDRAIERAEAGAQTCASETTWAPDRATEYLGLAQAYALSDAPADGAEVFSSMRTTALLPTAHLDRFFDTGHERQRDVEGSEELA